MNLIPYEKQSIDLAIAAWLDAKENRSHSAKTKKAYEDTITMFRASLQRIGLDLDSDTIQVSLIAQKFAQFSAIGKQVKPSTANQRLAILSSFYGHAHKLRLVAENPIDLVDRSKVQAYGASKFLTSAAITDKMKSIDRNIPIGARDYAILGILLQTGRRLSEVQALEWRNLEINEERITITFENCKGGKTMYDALPVPLSKAILSWLRMIYGSNLETIQPDSPLWINFARNAYDGNQLGIQSIADICKKRLGISRVHVTRHSWAHRMVEEKATLTEIQARLGHESLATTGRYVAMLQSAENQYAEAISKAFGLEE